VKIVRNVIKTTVGSGSGYTGTAYADTIATPTDGSRLVASNVHFAPGARTAWHSHPKGQTIWVTEGVGLVQRRGGAIEVVHPGDRVFFEPDEDHWHGAAATRFMTHIAMLELGDDGNAATIGEQVTDAEYATAPDVDAQDDATSYLTRRSE
jgi:quercetin dioxygenase-like cupin family protein